MLYLSTDNIKLIWESKLVHESKAQFWSSSIYLTEYLRVKCLFHYQEGKEADLKWHNFLSPNKENAYDDTDVSHPGMGAKVGRVSGWWVLNRSCMQRQLLLYRPLGEWTLWIASVKKLSQTSGITSILQQSNSVKTADLRDDWVGSMECFKSCLSLASLDNLFTSPRALDLVTTVYSHLWREWSFRSFHCMALSQ